MEAGQTDISKVETIHVEEIQKSDLYRDGKGDEALKILSDLDIYTNVDPEVERKLVRKVDWMILPFLAVCYTFFYIDKTTLSYAALFGLKTDLNLQGTEYSWLSSIFYFGYLFWAFPTNYFLLRLPVAKYLGFNIFMWGALLMCQAACNSFATLAVVRALGGAAEACADPAFMLITSMWYTRKEQPVRIGLWYAANGFGIAMGGLLGYAIGHIDSSLASWRYEFIIIGAACCVWGIVIVFFLPDSPVKNRYLNDDEKRIIILRLRDNQTGVETKVFKKEQFYEALLDVKVWAFFFIAMFANIPNGGYSNFGTLIIQGFGFSPLLTAVMQIPNGAIISISILSCVFINDRIGGNRRVMMLVIFMLPNVAGSFGLYFLSNEHKIGRLICYYLTGPYNASFVILLSLNTSNIAGHTKKVTVNALLFLGYCVGNIAGPFFYKAAQAPRYPLGMGSLMFSHLSEILLSILLGLYLRRQNKKRDAIGGAMVDYSTSFADITDKKNANFRYIY